VIDSPSRGEDVHDLVANQLRASYESFALESSADRVHVVTVTVDDASQLVIIKWLRCGGKDIKEAISQHGHLSDRSSTLQTSNLR
jgi:hypothetical protein